jgi:hypothetical protein
VDVDVKKGAQGRATIGRFLERSPVFQQTMLVSTPSGGDHYYFAGQYKGSKHPFGPGVDVQGVGAYVLVPPSLAASQYDEAGKPVAGSEQPYVVKRPSPIQPFPFDLIPAQVVAQNAPPGWIDLEARQYDGAERETIPHGQHRQSLLWLGWHLRAVQGLSVEAALPILRAFIEVGTLEGYNPNDPFTDKKLRDDLKGVKPNVAMTPPPVAMDEAIVTARQILSQRPPPRRNFIAGLIHQGKLHVFYGDSGIGKTTIVAYELALMTRMGFDVLVFVQEDSPYDFSTLFALAGGDIDKLHIYRQNVRELLLPKDKGILEQHFAKQQWGAVYFDSILDLRSTSSRENAANAARDLFAPISELADRYNIAVICTTHTNRAGTFEGSAQIRAKCRMFAKVHRPEPLDIPPADENGMIDLDQWTDPKFVTYVTNEKAQRGSKQNARYAFYFDILPSKNPIDGKVDFELDADGNTVEVDQYVCVRHAEVPNTSLPQEKGPERVDLRPRVAATLALHPEWPVKNIAREVGARISDVANIVKELRKK